MSDLTPKDIEERDESRKILRELHLAVIGDDTKGIKGLVKRVEVVEQKLNTDHELLWLNRKFDEAWVILRRPFYYFVATLVLTAIAGANIWDAVKLGLRKWFGVDL